MKRPLVFFAASIAALAGYCVAPAQVLAAEAPANPPVAPTPTSTPGSSIVPSDKNYQSKTAYQIYFADYLALKRGRPVDLIFIGDSITEQWRWGTGNPVWKKQFEDRALDFGLGSDKTQDTLWRLKNIDLKAWSPKVAIVLIGTNNNSDSPEEIAAGVKAVIATTQETFPAIKIVLMSILPNARATEKMAAANGLIAPLADGKNVVYLDLAAKFTPEGNNWLGLGRDRLHLTTAGYEMWAAELEKVLPSLLAQH